MAETLSSIQCPMCKGEGKIKSTLIGNVLRIKRAECGVTLSDVAKIIDVSVSKLSRIENHLTKPTFHDGISIAKWCGLSGDDLMALVE